MRFDFLNSEYRIFCKDSKIQKIKGKMAKSQLENQICCCCCVCACGAHRLRFGVRKI